MRHDADDPSQQTAHAHIYLKCSDVLRHHRSSEAAVHGSLLAMKQLLVHRTIQNNFDAVCGPWSGFHLFDRWLCCPNPSACFHLLCFPCVMPGLVLRHKDSRHQIVREAVLGTMPLLAEFDPDKYVQRFLCLPLQ